jgi:tetratricopeptide (TPR) repeat protein
MKIPFGFTLRYLLSIAALILVVPALPECRVRGESEPSKGKFNESSPILSNTIPIDREIQGKLKELSGNPDDPGLLMDLGNAYVRKNWFRRAQQAYNAVLKKDRTYYRAHHELGALYIQVGELGDAEHELKKALKTNPAYAPSHYNLGKIYLKERNFKESIKEFSLAFQLDPTLGNVSSNPVVIYNSVYPYAQLANYMESSSDAVSEGHKGFEEVLLRGVLIEKKIPELPKPPETGKTEKPAK